MVEIAKAQSSSPVAYLYTSVYDVYTNNNKANTNFIVVVFIIIILLSCSLSICPFVCLLIRFFIIWPHRLRQHTDNLKFQLIPSIPLPFPPLYLIALAYCSCILFCTTYTQMRKSIALQASRRTCVVDSFVYMQYRYTHTERAMCVHNNITYQTNI